MILPTLIGREREIERLRTFLNHALAGQGQTAFVAGEAGSGKSALVRAFAEQVQIEHSDVVVAIGNCNAQSGVGDPYLPFRDVLAVLTGLSETVVAQPAANRLKNVFARVLQVLVETAPDLIGTLLPDASVLGKMGKSVADKSGWLDKLDQMATHSPTSTAAGGATVFDQDRVFEEYTGLLLALAATHPLLLILDDLQWADEASIALLFHLSRRIEQSRILILGAYRPDEVAMPRRDAHGNEQHHPLEKVLSEIKRYSGDVWIDLGKVQAAGGRAFTDQLIDAQPNRLDEPFRAKLFERTGGNALFTVELLHTLQERGGLVRDEQGCWVTAVTLDWDTVPARVEGVLEERLARLDQAERRLLDAASVEGEQFFVEVIGQVEQLPLRQVIEGLDQQLDKRHHLVREQGNLQLSGRRLTRYQFVHVLFQQFCYQALSSGERRLLHGDVAHTLEQLCATDLDAMSGQLAWHYEHAGLSTQAIDYYRRAGIAAQRVCATNQAIDHFNKGLALLAELPASPERDKQELSLQLAMAVSARAKSFVSGEVSRALSRAMELSRNTAQGDQQFWPLWGLQQLRLARGEIGQAQELVPRLLAIAEKEQSPPLLLAAHLNAAGVDFWRGDLLSGATHMAKSAAFYAPELSAALIAYSGVDLGVHTQAGNANVIWFLGHVNQALQECQKAVELAEQMEHPATLVIAVAYLAMLHQFRREIDETLTQAQVILALATQNGANFYSYWAPILIQWALAHTHPGPEQISALRQALDDYYATSARLRWPYYLSLLAEIYLMAGQPVEGLAAIDEAVACATEQDEHWWDAELYRLRGELLLLQGAEFQQVEVAFQQALDIARQQQARALELRAATSLARLWRQSRREQAMQLLSAVFQQFDQGFDTLDLQEAKALLAELS